MGRSVHRLSPVGAAPLVVVVFDALAEHAIVAALRALTSTAGLP